MNALTALHASVSAPWRDQARCLDADPAAFFPDKGGQTNDAKALCGGCPVVEECLEEALMISGSDDFGVWGGTSEQERRKIRRQRGIVGLSLEQARNRPPCGTNAGAKRHWRNGEHACPPCAQAAALYQQEGAA